MRDIDIRPASELNDEELAQRQAEDPDVSYERVSASLPNVIIQRLDKYRPFYVYRIHTITSDTKQ